MARAVEADIPVIPVLLPDTEGDARLPMFVRMFRWVAFNSFSESGAMDELIWGITGKRPR
jgi:hypothetical protein